MSNRFLEHIGQGKSKRVCAQLQTCIVCLGGQRPDGWFREEIDLAINVEIEKKSVRVFAVLMPNANANVLPPVLAIRQYIEFRRGTNRSAFLNGVIEAVHGLPTNSKLPKVWETKEAPQAELLFQQSARMQVLEEAQRCLRIVKFAVDEGLVSPRKSEVLTNALLTKLLSRL